MESDKKNGEDHLRQPIAGVWGRAGRGGDELQQGQLEEKQGGNREGNKSVSISHKKEPNRK